MRRPVECGGDTLKQKNMVKTFKGLRGTATLYLGDCLEILPTLTGIDAVITDPPYGIGRDGSNESTGSHGGRKAYEFGGWDSEPPSAEFFQLCFRISKTQVFWGGNYFTKHLPSTMGWLVWDKGQDICGSDCELAFTSLNQALRRKKINRVEIARDGAVHPTQKPVIIMSWSMDIAKVATGATVLDPYMGSGTTGIACLRTGRNFIGIELDPKYYAIACDRIAREIDGELI